MHMYYIATEGECTDGSIRLVNGENEYTGGLEYCHLGCWGTVCGYNYDWTHGTWTESFTMEDASVACRQLGYSPEGTYVSLMRFHYNIHAVHV